MWGRLRAERPSPSPKPEDPRQMLYIIIISKEELSCKPRNQEVGLHVSVRESESIHVRGGARWAKPEIDLLAFDFSWPRLCLGDWEVSIFQ